MQFKNHMHPNFNSIVCTLYEAETSLSIYFPENRLKPSIDQLWQHLNLPTNPRVIFSEVTEIFCLDLPVRSESGPIRLWLNGPHLNRNIVLPQVIWIPIPVFLMHICCLVWYKEGSNKQIRWDLHVINIDVVIIVSINIMCLKIVICLKISHQIFQY